MENKDQIKALKMKIKALENELEFTKASHRQIMDEKSLESHDERRIYMLKSQIFQLERQCMLYSKALSSRENVLQEIENQVIKLTEDFQNLLAKDIKGPSVPIAKSQIVSYIQALQKLKGSLFRQTAYESSEEIQNPLTVSAQFTKSDAGTLKCVDVCNINFRHVNMTEVSKLESKLHTLFKQSLHLKHRLQDMLSERDMALIPNAIYTNLIEVIEENCSHLNIVCGDLLRLSMLYPNNQNHGRRSSANKEFFFIKSTDILKSIKPISPKAKEAIVAMSKVHAYFVEMTKMEIEALNLEIDYHRRTKNLQYEYAANIMNIVSEGYNESGKVLVQNIELPLKKVITAWNGMKNNQNEETLREFLKCIKTNEAHLESLSELSNNQGINAIYDLKLKLDAENKKLKAKFDEDFEEIKSKTEHFKEQNISCIEFFQQLTLKNQDK